MFSAMSMKFTCCFKHCLFAVVYLHHVQSMTNAIMIGKNMVSNLSFVSSFIPAMITKMSIPSMNKVHMLLSKPKFNPSPS